MKPAPDRLRGQTGTPTNCGGGETGLAVTIYSAVKRCGCEHQLRLVDSVRVTPADRLSARIAPPTLPPRQSFWKDDEATRLIGSLRGAVALDKIHVIRRSGSNAALRMAGCRTRLSLRSSNSVGTSHCKLWPICRNKGHHHRSALPRDMTDARRKAPPHSLAAQTWHSDLRAGAVDSPRSRPKTARILRATFYAPAWPDADHQSRKF